MTCSWMEGWPALTLISSSLTACSVFKFLFSLFQSLLQCQSGAYIPLGFQDF